MSFVNRAAQGVVSVVVVVAILSLSIASVVLAQTEKDGTVSITAEVVSIEENEISRSTWLYGASVILEGEAVPFATVYLQKEGQIIDTGQADEEGNFEMTEEVSAGIHTFSVYAEDPQHRKTRSITFSVDAEPSARITAQDIYTPPTIDVNDQESSESFVVLSGYAVADYDVHLIYGDLETQSRPGSDGFYTFTILRDSLTEDASIYAYQEPEDGMIRKSREISLGEMQGSGPDGGELLRGDVNYDGRVNLVDFFMLKQWYEFERLSQAVLEVESQVLNADGQIDLKDFSFLAYYWTG